MNRTVLLTGASGGLGKYYAEALAKEGYSLALQYNTGKEKIGELLKSLESFKVRVKAYRADITSEQQACSLVADALKDFGSIDILINNAGISIDGTVRNLTLKQWNDTLAVNLTAPFLLAREVLPLMKKNNFGRIINISSVVAKTGVPGTAAYAASKAGLEGFTKATAKEAAKNNITVNTLCLGYFNTGTTGMLHRIPADLREKIQHSIPKDEFGNPSEAARCIIYLCSEQASYMTGQTLHLNGGLYS